MEKVLSLVRLSELAIGKHIVVEKIEGREEEFLKKVYEALEKINNLDEEKNTLFYNILDEYSLRQSTLIWFHVNKRLLENKFLKFHLGSYFKNLKEEKYYTLGFKILSDIMEVFLLHRILYTRIPYTTSVDHKQTTIVFNSISFEVFSLFKNLFYQFLERERGEGHIIHKSFKSDWDSICSYIEKTFFYLKN